MHADWPAIQGIGKAKNCTQADTDTRQVRPPREHAGPWPERACLTRPNSPGSRDPTPTGSHLGNHARTPGETHLLSCAAAHDQHDGEAELKRILRDLGPHRGEALRDRARLPNRHPGSSVRVSREMIQDGPQKTHKQNPRSSVRVRSSSPKVCGAAAHRYRFLGSRNLYRLAWFPLPYTVILNSVVRRGQPEVFLYLRLP